MAGRSLLTISQLSARSGAAPSALRYYEELGLIQAERTSGQQRRYPAYMLRRVAFIRAGRQLPSGQAPTRADWSRAARTWEKGIDAKIAELERLKSTLSSCIGCGCLSLRRCALYNPGDMAAQRGPGARWLLGDEPPA
jgi:MerR family transcriptional regulator, redox-sensitive transcriptional activator SoxR